MDPQKPAIKTHVCNHILSASDSRQNLGNLYLGAFGSLKPQILEMHRISAILTAMDGYMYKKLAIKQRVAALNVTEHKWVELQDSEEEDISKHFEECYNFIEQALRNHNVLVHCQAGISRSATIVIYYVMRKLNLSLDMANKLVVSKRYVASPNEGFWAELQKQERYLGSQGKDKIKEGIYDPQSQFRSEKYPQKFANHIICLNEGQLEHGNLFLGQFSILKSQFLKSLIIKSVVSVVDEAYYKRMKIKEIIEHEGIVNHLWINVRDEPAEDISHFFEETFNFIDENIRKGNVLVHCQAGVSRSASVVIAFLIKKFKVSFEKAFKFVQSKRKVVNPNEGFQLRLVEYSQKMSPNL